MGIFDGKYDRISEIKKKRESTGAASAATSTGGGMKSPFDGYRVTSKPGKRNAPTAGASTAHKGLDRAVPKGTALSLPIDVTYYKSGSDKARGNWIEFKDDGGNILHFQHLDSYGSFKAGQRVAAGSQIAVSGNSGIGTGAHLHEEYYTPDGKNITESYWNRYANGAVSGAEIGQYTPAKGNVFNTGTGAVAQKGYGIFSGESDRQTRAGRVAALRARRAQRKEKEEKAAARGGSLYRDVPASAARTAGGFGKSTQQGRSVINDFRLASGATGKIFNTTEQQKMFRAAVGAANPIKQEVDKWVRKENEKAQKYRGDNDAQRTSAAQRVLENADTLSKGVKYREYALDAAKEWGVKNRTTKAADLLVSGNKKIAERELDIKNLAEYMTDEELIIYSGILMTEGRAEAEKFLDTMKEELRGRAFEHEQYPERFGKTAAELYNNPLGLPEGEYQGANLKGEASEVIQSPTLEDIEKRADKNYIAAIGDNIAGSFGAVGSVIPTAAQAVKNAVTGEYEPVNQYNAFFHPARISQAAQEGALRERSGWVKFLKSAGFSITQSAATAAAGTFTGGGGASLAMMGASAGGGAAADAVQRGLTPGQSLALGTVLDGLEAATEKIPLDNMLDAFGKKSAGRKLMRNILSSAVENAGQEGINEIAGNAAERIIAGDRSEFVLLAKSYAGQLQADEGLSDEEATKKGTQRAFFDRFIAAPIYSAVSGAFTGAIQTGGAGVAGAAVNDVARTVEAYGRGMNADTAINKLGYRVEITNDESLDGKADKAGKVVYFNLKSENLDWTIKHEITHLFEKGAKWYELKEYVKENMPETWRAAERRVVDLRGRVNAARAKQGLAPYAADDNTIEAETMAEISEVLKTERMVRRFALGKDVPVLMRFIEFARDTGENVKSKFGTDTGWTRAAQIWGEALYETENGNVTNEEYRLTDIDDEGVEIYETSDEIKRMPYAGRKKQFVNLMKNEFRGRTARFEKNGAVYYARFAYDDIRKNVYGDKNSDKSGYDAKINIGADGGIFDLVENARYKYSSAEDGKTTKSHKSVTDWDYFIKTVKIDGRYFDVFANVRINGEGEFVYDVSLTENTKKEHRHPSHGFQDWKGVRSGAQRSVSSQNGSYPFSSYKNSGEDVIDRIAQNGEAVNTGISKSNENVTNEEYRLSDAEVNAEDVRAIQAIGRKSVNNFSGDDIKATENFARRYYREMGAKSPFFRAWFGDWRANDDTPVHTVTERADTRGVVKNNDTGWEINISGKVFNETKSHNSSYAKKGFPYLEYINGIVENSVLLDSYTIPGGKGEI